MRLLITGLLFCLGSASAAGLSQEQRNIPDNIERIVVEVPGDVLVYHGKTARLSIEAEEAVLGKLEANTLNDTLYLRSKGSFSTQKAIRFRIELPNLHYLSLRSSGDVEVHSFSGQSLNLDLAGSGDIDLSKANYQSLHLLVSGSGAIEVKGQGNNLRAEVSGSGDIEAEMYPVLDAVARITGAGNININVKNTLDASIIGSGDIRYKGKPEIKSSLSGSGNIESF